MRKIFYFLVISLFLWNCSEKYETNPVSSISEIPIVKDKKGKLSVLIKPIVGDVYIDGKKKASDASEYSDSLDAGDHELKVVPSSDDYWTFLQKVEVPSGGLEVVKVDLEKKNFNTGSLIIRTEEKEKGIAVIGASYKVFHLDGTIYEGKTPANQVLPTGAVVVRVSKNGYYSYEKDAQVESGKTTSLLFQMERMTDTTLTPVQEGVFAAISVPQEVNVVVVNAQNDTVAEFQTPYQMELPLGSYIAIASKEGYSSESFAFQMTQEQTFVVHKFLLKEAEPLIGSFSVSPTKGYAPLDVEVSAEAFDEDGDTLHYQWDFDDGSIEIGSRITHTYDSLGLYTVSPNRGEAPLTISYSVEASDEDGDMLSYVWEFGNGQMAVRKSGEYTYQSPGLYTVRLTVRDGKDGVDYRSQAVLATEPPKAGNTAPEIIFFSVDPTRGFSPLTISCSVKATDKDGDVLDYQWDFGDKEKAQGEDVLHTYQTPGLYTITLLVTDKKGGTAVRSISVLVEQKTQPENNSPRIISFSVSPTSGYAPLEIAVIVEATDEDNDKLTYSVDFGDGSSASGNTSPIQHTYSQPGLYNVQVVVTDGKGGSDTRGFAQPRRSSFDNILLC